MQAYDNADAEQAEKTFCFWNNKRFSNEQDDQKNNGRHRHSVQNQIPFAQFDEFTQDSGKACEYNGNM